MLRITKLIFLGAFLILGACTHSIRNDVVSFHKLEKPQSETFTIVPKDEGVEAGLEFNSYAKLVEAELNALGYRAVSNSDSDLLIKISYGVGEGKEKVRSVPQLGGSFQGNWGFGIGFGNDIFWPGFRISRPELYAYTQYTRRFEMDIVKVDSDEILFEGRVISPGKDKRLPEGMPYLVKALFSNFPGESGKTRKVIISTENQ